MTDTTELAGLPEGGPATLALIRAKLKLRPEDTDHDDVLTEHAEAVNYMVRRWPVSQLAVDANEWPASITTGAVMLAVRLWRRKDSPAGVETFGQLGGAYVMRNDPDIAMLLQLGSYQRPGIG